MSLREQRMSYWGHRFESYMTNSKEPVNTNVEYCVVFKTKLGQHRLLMAAEIDCIASTDNAKRRNTAMPDYVELKTTKKVASHRSKDILFQ
jgi:RAT1-interacting protein